MHRPVEISFFDSVFDSRQPFVGRRSEIMKLVRTVAATPLTGGIIGQAGIGKTTLLNAAMNFLNDQFEGGIAYAQGDAVRNFIGNQRDIPQSAKAFLKAPSGRKSLLVVDEIDAVQDRELIAAINNVDPLISPLSVIAAGRRLPDELLLHETIAMAPLTSSEILQLFETRAGRANLDVDPQIRADVFRLTGGIPLLSNLAIKAIQDGAVESYEELVRRLQPFRISGLLGPDGRPLEQGQPTYDLLAADVGSTNAKLIELLQSNPELMRDLPSRKFEELVAELLSRQGYAVELTQASKHGGFDIYAARKEALGSFLFLVECKRYAEHRKVGVEVIRSLYGTVQAEKASAGAVVSTSFFTKGAKDFQRKFEHQMHLHDYLTLQDWLKR